MQPRVRRILRLAGYRLRIGPARPGDLVAVWGHAEAARRGAALAKRRGAALLRIEDAFLRSLEPGRAGAPPMALTVDHRGCHFDATLPSDLEHLLKSEPLNDPALLARAEGVMARLREAHLTKYAAVDPDLALPTPGFVLVIDQVRGDASVRLGRADAATFAQMLARAQAENPGVPVVIKTHPETRAGFRAGYFGASDATDRVTLLDSAISPWRLLEAASAVYTVSSQLGFEAILAGHRPRVFGIPFYAGWGLSEDRHPDMPGPDRRGRRLTPAQLVAGAMLLYPLWYDPCRDRLCAAEDTIEALAAQARSWREDRQGWRGLNIRLWKRQAFQRFFGTVVPMRFTPAPDRRRVMSWAARTPQADTVVRVEDGFLRSRGLGAALVPPLSLVLDDLGIYYDPARESRLERLIATRSTLRADQRARAEALIARLRAAGLSKYNTGQVPDLSHLRAGRRLLVPGQVEDDASVRLGAGAVRTNLALLQAARAAHPDAVILYKPHPDVEAGLRPGAIDAGGLADAVLRDVDPGAVLGQVDAVCTMTSLIGFEALLRGLPVQVLGQPFYAGWGLTDDLGPQVDRRRARPDLAGLVHATLIDYPRYRDPVSELPCPVEVVVDRLAEGRALPRGPALRLLARAQGLAASHARIWR
ncbi:capsular polysaccharide biosynthesis protein [Pseudooceanicola sediminis]|nr:capsular polysaccharide biosynthesis protein [Pseudooceanicola sediminis]|tara:strand:- start:6767 stop:8704 length:1938 start_codon:yes stop_codon:yes gene_type:complete